ncbi:fatty acyl-CoA reductase 1-like [Diaphorina citri]|uniref:Fatty acyl-CoA reductase n=1 Tax=Diaphorina citri TaxID=121845 RepID=A0A3Q0J484_DIACI|nr:fatty acyl-CoA reductase 1-like [Diaphorina citri]
MSAEVISERRPSMTPIQQFYDGANILITGGTGFFGRVLLSKLLSDCPGVNKIYLLIREKRGKTSRQRIKLASSFVYEYGPNFESRFSTYTSSSLYQTSSKVNKETYKTRFPYIFSNSNAFSHLFRPQSFVHVSTAYSNCRQPIIEERFYEPPVNPNHLIQITELLNDDMIDKITPGIVDYWPNTYALTKQVAEDMVRRGGAGMPVAMVRPSIGE